MSAFVALYAAIACLWLLLVRVQVPIGTAVLIAIALRLLVLLPAPLLSGDVHRYLSDGRMLAGGVNPYTYTPADPRINHPEIRSIYPPHAQLLFLLVHELTWWRLLIVAFDVLAIFLLREFRFAYATCPLVLFEGTWSGHLDAIAAVFLLIALTRRSGAALAFAGGLKVIPLAAFPVLARNANRRSALAFLATFTLPILPFLGKPIMPGFREYATRWIFNAPAYDLVRAIVSHIPTKEIWTRHPLRFQWLSDFVYQRLYDDFLTRAVLVTVAVGGILLARRVTTAVGILLLCSPAIHPWYWLTLVPSALVERSRGWLLVALCAPASYLLYAGESPLAVYALCYLTPLLLSGSASSAAARLRAAIRFRTAPDTFRS
ncbi:MAG TPA: hypothetical protein VHW00_23285 [Thermoanaerobaculia bacterium]|nr:hypothetical protein [Thermoanaerobaculia bacterium]